MWSVHISPWWMWSWKCFLSIFHNAKQRVLSKMWSRNLNKADGKPAKPSSIKYVLPQRVSWSMIQVCRGIPSLSWAFINTDLAFVLWRNSRTMLRIFISNVATDFCFFRLFVTTRCKPCRKQPTCFKPPSFVLLLQPFVRDKLCKMLDWMVVVFV